MNTTLILGIVIGLVAARLLSRGIGGTLADLAALKDKLLGKSAPPSA